VRTDTPEHFMDDLKKYGYIKGWTVRSFIITLPAGLGSLHFRWGFFFFHRRDAPVLQVFQRGSWKPTGYGVFFPRHMTKTDYPWLFLPVYRSRLPLMVSSLIFALTFKQVEIMEICYIEAGVLERMLARAENLSAHVDRLYERNRRKEPGEWLDGQDVCLRLDISPRTLQTLRDTGRLAFTRLQRKFYYKPEDVERLITYVGIRRKEKAVREGRKNGNL
jgi:hypothetical protein